MLRLDRICSYILIAAFALQLPSVSAFKFADELIAALLGMLAVADCVFNQAWRRYRLLWIIMGIMTFYAIYSVAWMRYNSPAAVAVDWIIELKPFVPFVVFLAIRPILTGPQMQALRLICYINAGLSLIILLLPDYMVRQLVGHVYVPGNTLLLSAVLYAYTCGTDCREPKNVAVIISMLCAGLLCTRSKYYGIFVVSVFFLFFYTPGMLRQLSPRKLAIIAGLPLIVVAVGWSKFSYYFINGGEAATTYDPEMLESFARPVLYATGALIFIEHIPFGSGLASFASWASADPYSSLYFQYGINNVYGLSPDRPWFICDAFYPSLAQFGFAGMALFVWFWIYVASLLKRLIRSNPTQHRIDFACGWIIICFILIESIAGTTFVQTQGMCGMMMLGLICSQALSFSTNHQTQQPTLHSDGK